MSQHYWVTNAAQEHVNLVRQKGYTQLNMGPREPLKKMNQGDWIIYYSPTVLFQCPDTACHTFTAISCLTDNHIYQQPTNHERWRRNVQYFECKPHHVQHFHHSVDFMKQYEDWLDALLEPIFEISRNDFATIANKIIIPSNNYSLIF